MLAHVATWEGGTALAVHNFADAPARVTVDCRRTWPPALAPPVRHADGERPPLDGGRLSVELPPYGYHWFGARAGV